MSPSSDPVHKFQVQIQQSKNWRWHLLGWERGHDHRKGKAKEDAKIVEGIADEIEKCLGEKAIIHDLWFDQWKMRAGRWHQDQMAQGLQDSDLLILIVSKHSLGSNAVSLEWKTKFAEKISKNKDSVFPFFIDDTSTDELSPYLAHIHSYRMGQDLSKVARLVDDILNWREETPTNTPRVEKRRRSARDMRPKSRGA